MPRGLIAGDDGLATATVTIVREEGAVGPVTVHAEQLPDGASADTLVIPDGENAGTLTIHTDAAARGLTPIEVVAGSSSHSARAVLATGGIANGVLDPTFGDGGMSAEYIVPRWSRQADGTLLVVSGGTIVRLNADGSPSGFSTSALVPDWVTTVATLPDGGLIAGGQMTLIENDHFVVQGALWRVGADGQQSAEILPDATRGILGVAVEPGGAIRAVGQTQGFALTTLRVDPAGAVTFGGAPVLVGVPGSIADVAALPDGGWLLAGGDLHVARLVKIDATGALDPRFGDGGVRAPDDAHYLGVHTLPDGGFMALRTDRFEGAEIDAFVERFDAQGGLLGVWQFAVEDRAAAGWAFDAGGRAVIAVAGTTRSSVLRLGAASGGSFDIDLDPDFGDAGLMDVSDYTDAAAPIRALATDSRGRILVSDTAGTTMRILP